MELIVFLIIFIALIVVILTLLFKTRANIFGILFLGVLLIGSAFYLFQYGALSKFTFKMLSTEASFVKEKVKEVKQDAAIVDNLRKSIQEQANEIQSLVENVKKSEKDILDVRDRAIGIEGDLIKVKKGIVEIQYLTYAGRNKFPNPYHDRIMQQLNELLIIALPDPKQREIFVQELQEYSEKLKK